MSKSIALHEIAGLPAYTIQGTNCLFYELFTTIDKQIQHGLETLLIMK